MLPLIQQSIQLQTTPAKVSIKRSARTEVAMHNVTENNVRGFDQLELLNKGQSPLWQTQILSALPFNSP